MSSYLLSRVGFLPSLGYNVLMKKMGKREWYHQICPYIILGAIPLTSMTTELVNKAGVRAVLSMNEKFELKYLTPSKQQWMAMGVEQLNLPVTDFVGNPSQQQINQGVQFIHDHVSSKRTVYIHCKAGRSRSATILACYFVKHWQLTPQEVTEFLVDKRSHVLFGRGNLRTIQQYYEAVANNP